MIGVIPSSNKTYEIIGDFNSKELIEGKLYYDQKDKRLYMYSSSAKRSNPSTGYFPVWDGKNKYISNFSNTKYFDKDSISMDVSAMSKSIDSDKAKNILYQQRLINNSDKLQPSISIEDNMFTQCIKGTICAMNLTIIDLYDMASGFLSEKQIDNYYSSLIKITFMRLEKWNNWLNIILHVYYTVDIIKKGKTIIKFNSKTNKFNTGIVKYDDIIKSDDDAFKKIVKLIMVMENINKTNLKSDEIDDYTINNMMTTLNSDKPLSAQLFSRFISMTDLSYIVKIYDKKDKLLFTYDGT